MFRKSLRTQLLPMVKKVAAIEVYYGIYDTAALDTEKFQNSIDLLQENSNYLKCNEVSPQLMIASIHSKKGYSEIWIV